MKATISPANHAIYLVIDSNDGTEFGRVMYPLSNPTGYYYDTNYRDESGKVREVISGRDRFFAQLTAEMAVSQAFEAADLGLEVVGTSRYSAEGGVESFDVHVRYVVEINGVLEFLEDEINVSVYGNGAVHWNDFTGSVYLGNYHTGLKDLGVAGVEMCAAAA